MRLSITSRRVVPMADLALAAGTIVFLVAVTPQIEPGRGERSIDAIAYALLVGSGAALVVRRRWPLPVVATVTAALSVYLARDYPGGPVFLTEIIALYSLATAWDRRKSFVVAGVAAGWLIALGLALETGPGLVHLVFAGWAAAAVFLGDAVRSRRDHVISLEERARHLEQRREEEAARRVAEERLRIARDLHDGVAHSMTAINVQAGTAAHIMGRQHEQAREALLVIQQQSREALEELASLLRILRDPGEEPTRSPSPGLADIDALISSTRRAGVDVDLRRDGRPVAPPAVAVAAYRIVQESLTNVVRHAGPSASVTVAVSGDDEGGLTVEIIDDGTGAPPTPVVADGATGVGIIGMKERAESTGGTLAAAVRPDGVGFAVRAHWPGRE